jgi:hypothetical protein
MTKTVTDRNKNRKIFGSFAMAIFIFAVTPSICSAGNIQQIKNEYLCDDTKVTIISDCDRDELPPYFPSCNKQSIMFSRQGKDITVKASGKLTSVRDGKGRVIGKWLDAVISSVACVQGKNKHYLLLSYYTGGNCEQCEWYDIYDLNGSRLAGGSSRNDKRKTNATYKKLEMPKEWSWSLFKNVDYKR